MPIHWAAPRRLRWTPAPLPPRVSARPRRVVGALLLTLLGCKSEVPQSTTVIGRAPGGLVMRPCVHRDTIPAECGTLTVPERRDKPEGRLIAVPVLRVRATGPAPGLPIFFLNGGPGASNQRTRPPVWSRADHDFILVGFRGVDGSDRLDCPEFAQALLASLTDLLSAASIDRRRDGASRCAERIQRSGVDLTGFTMHEVVDDVDAARAALGIDRLMLYSESYGTRLAQLYAARHPTHVARSVMVGVNPPGRFIWETAQLDSLIRRYSLRCASDVVCRARTPDLEAAVARVAHDMPTHWGPFPIHRGVVLLAAFQLFFSTETAGLALDAFVDADQGDASGLAALSLLASYQLSDFDLVFGDMFAKGSADFDSLRASPAAFDLSGSVMGSPMSAVFWTALTDSGGWPIVRPPDADGLAPASGVETLLVSGNLDVSTPAVYAARELMPQLPNGRQVIFQDAGHNDLWEFQGPGYARLVGGFFTKGTVDTSGIATRAMKLHSRWTLSRLAKLALAGVAVALMLIVFTVRALARRFRAPLVTRRSCSEQS